VRREPDEIGKEDCGTFPEKHSKVIGKKNDRDRSATENGPHFLEETAL